MDQQSLQKCYDFLQVFRLIKPPFERFNGNTGARMLSTKDVNSERQSCDPHVSLVLLCPFHALDYANMHREC